MFRKFGYLKEQLDRKYSSVTMTCLTVWSLTPKPINGGTINVIHNT